MHETRVGIVIPSFESGPMVAEAAASARDCLGGTDDVVVVDDGSTDRRSLQVLEGLRRDGFTVHRQANAGVSVARNRGLASLRTPYAFVLDSDDLIEPGAATIAADLLDADADIAIVAGAGIDFTGTAPDPGDPAVSPGEVTRRDMWRSSRIATASAFRVEDWASSGGFPPGVAVGEDWVFWLRLLRDGGRVLTADAVFVRHRLHAGQVTRRPIDPRESAKAANLVLRENPDLALEHAEDLFDELCRARTTLAAYRHAYRRPDLVKARVHSFLRAAQRRRERG